MRIHDEARGHHRLLSTFETADYLGVPRQTLAMWRSHATGPVFIRVGRHIKYRRTDLDAWIDTCAVHPEQPRTAAW